MKLRFTGVLTLLLVFTIQFSFAQERTITGTVTSAEDGLPLPGASVVIEGTTRGARTDLDGKFSIKANQGEKLVFSFVGTKNQTITIGASDVINVVLSTDNIIEQVDLDVYRKITPRTLAISQKTIGGDVMEERANVSALQGLQGMVAGVYISMGSGQPGSVPAIVVRGIGSINGATSPLYVIDGMPVEAEVFRTLSPNDIKSYTVLKDAAATSIYGNRGANGVIVITTKTGQFNQELQIRYVGQSGFTEIQNPNIELMNSSQILNFQKQYGMGRGSTMQQWEIDQLAANTNTFWTDVFFRTGSTQQHDLSLSSGSERTANHSTINYTDQEGTFMDSSIKRFNLRNNFVGKSKDNKFNYNFNMGMTYVKNESLVGAGSNNVYDNPFFAALMSFPYLSPYNPDGSLTLYGPYTSPSINPGFEGVPFVMLNRIQLDRVDTNDLRLLAGFSANYEILKNVTAGMRLGGDYINRGVYQISHPLSITSIRSRFNSGRMYSGFQNESSRKDFTFNALYSLGYVNTFNAKHNLSLSAFFEYNKAHRKAESLFQNGLDPKFVGTDAGFIPGNTIDPVNPAQRFYVPEISSNILTEGLLSYFATGSYDFDEKYVLNATIRRDGSFRFTEDNRWGTFWALGAAWNIDKENFMENSGFSYLKLRGSFGTNGNQRVTSNAPFTALSLTRNLYGPGTGYNASTSIVPTQIANTDLLWETVEQANVGLDFGLLDNRLSASIDVYQKTTKDLYSSIPVSMINAVSFINGNVGEMTNKGIELDFTYTILNNANWKVLANVNGSYNENEITKLHESFQGILDVGSNFALGEGHPYGSYYVSRYIGVNPSNGNPLFLDAAGNPTQNLSEEDRVFIGKTFIPKWQGGFGTQVSYKKFEFSTQWVFVADVYLSNSDYAILEDTASMADWNKTVTVLNAWQNPGDITSIPKVGVGPDYSDYTNSSDRYIEDASFLRLRNVTFAYQFSKEQLDKMPITGLRFFAQAENLLTFSGYRGWDAEHALRNFESTQYPTPRIYTLGMIVNF